MPTNQTPEALAKVLTNQLQLCIDDPMWANHFEMHKDTARLFIRNINRLRDMVASGAKDAEAATLLRVIQRLNQNPYSLTKAECIDEVKAMRDAAIDATKRGGE
jgi:hypothetical protein